MPVNKISVIQGKHFVKPQNVIKKALPAAGGLSVLAGSSMGPTIDPGIPHVPGTSVTDPFIDQLQHTGDMLLDTGSAIGEAAMHGISSLGGVMLDAGCTIVDGAASLGDKALEALDKLMDAIG